MASETTDTETLGTIGADRACAQCGFNLIGQQVAKEPHYGLAIATCPECGLAASLQTYPFMSKWADRWRAAIAAIWMILLVFIFIFQMGMLGTYADSMSHDASTNLAEKIGKAYDESVIAEGKPSQVTNWLSYGDMKYQWVQLPRDFADEFAPGIIDEHGGLIAMVDSGFLTYLFPGVIFAILLGMFWSVALLGASRRRAMVIPALLGIFIMLFALFPSLYIPSQGSAQQLAKEFYQPYITPAGILAQLPFVMLGIFIGRKFARLIIMLTLPPRLRVPFSIFWTRDGLAPPKSTFN